MTLTTDDLIAKFVLRDNPLQGPIILDYLTAGEQGPDLVSICFREDGDVVFPRKELSMVAAAENYWRIVSKWNNPTRSAIYGWIRDLCRHTIAMDELFFSSRYSGHVLDDVATVCGGKIGVLSMTGCVQTTGTESLESTYAESLKRNKREAMKVLLSAVIKDEKNMATDRMNLELIDTLRRAVSMMWFESISLSDLRWGAKSLVFVNNFLLLGFHIF